MFDKATLGYVIAKEIPTGSGQTGKRITKLERLGFKIYKGMREGLPEEEFKKLYAGKEKKIGIFSVGVNPTAKGLEYGALVLDQEGKFLWLPIEAIRIDFESMPQNLQKIYKGKNFVIEDEPEEKES